MNKTILVARGVLPDAFPPSYAVALAVAKLVSLPPAAVGPLSVLLATKPVSASRLTGLADLLYFIVSGIYIISFSLHTWFRYLHCLIALCHSSVHCFGTLFRCVACFVTRRAPEFVDRVGDDQMRIGMMMVQYQYHTIMTSMHDTHCRIVVLCAFVQLRLRL